jgi:hypothetical protein
MPLVAQVEDFFQQHRVLRDGCLVPGTDRAARGRFEVHRRREYFDLPILEEYRRPRKAAEA